MHPDATLAIVTDARPGRGLDQTGWEEPLSDTVTPEARQRIVDALAPLDGAEVDALLGRCHLIRLEWEAISAQTRTILQSSYELPGAAADLLRARLVDDLEKVAAGQREIGAGDATVRAVADVDALAARVSELIDVAALQAPVRNGLIEHLDFSRPVVMPAERFLTGVDVVPGHIAAKLDVLRVDELTALFDAIANDRYVVIAGPSGSGKSALLWRAAYELARAHRVVRVRRVALEDVTHISRWIRTLHPAPETPVLVCADDLGRPRTAGWPELAAELLEMPGVHLIGGAREEDFTPALVANGVPLRPQLTEPLAHEIEAQLAARGVALKATAQEALPDARGLLMEYVAILATGRRLEQVVAAQVHDRLIADRAVERDALRYVAAAHCAGLDIPATVLGDLCGNPPELQQALQRLADEFLIRAAGPDSWRGLHELRSAVVHRILHESPPPTEAETLRALAYRLRAPDTAHLVRRIADRGGPLAGVLASVSERMADQETTASEAVAWLDAVIAADVTAHVRTCVTAAEASWPRRDLPLLRFAWLRRFARLPDGYIPDEVPLDELAAVLPDPPTNFAVVAASTVAAERLEEWIASAALGEDAVAVAEAFAAAGPVLLDPGQVRTILKARQGLAVADFSRLVKALWTLSPDSHADPRHWFGGRNLRLDRLGRADTTILRWTTEPDSDSPGDFMVRLEVFLAAGELAMSRVRELSRVVLDLCPEIVRVQVEPRGPHGLLSEAPVSGGGRVQRSTYANPRIEGRRPRLMSQALERSRAAGSWAERLARQRRVVNVVGGVVDGAFARLLAAADNAGRRRDWLAQVDEAKRQVDALPAPPLPAPGEQPVADPARETLERIVLELGAFAGSLDRPRAFRRHGAGLRRAFSDFWLPYRETEALSDAGLAAQLADLRPPVMLLADLLTALAERPDCMRRGRPTLHTSYKAVAEAVVDEVRQAVLDGERQALEVAMSDGAVTVVQASDGEPPPGRLVDDTWLVGCRTEAWTEVIHAAPARLEDGMRHRLAGRVVAMYQVEDLFVPATAYRIGEEHPTVMSASEASALAQAAGVRTLADTQLDAVLELRDVLVEISAVSANLHQREWRFGTDGLAHEAETLLSRAEQLVARIEMPEGFPPAVPFLLDLARKEVSGSSGVSQAAGMAVLRRFGVNSLDSLLLDQVVGTAVAEAVRRAITS